MLTAMMRAEVAIPWLEELDIYQQGGAVTISLVE